MTQTSTVGITLMALSVIPILFLIYTLLNLNRLGIRISHPRVIVELMIFIGLLLAGLYLWLGLAIT